MTAKRKPHNDAKLQATIDRVFGVKGEPLNGRSPMEAYMENKGKVAEERAARVERIARLMHVTSNQWMTLNHIGESRLWAELSDKQRQRYNHVAAAVIAALEK